MLRKGANSYRLGSSTSNPSGSQWQAASLRGYRKPYQGLQFFNRWRCLVKATTAIGEGIPNPPSQPLAVNLLLVVMLTMVVSLVVAWKGEGGGGVLILGDFAFFAIQGIRFNMVFGSMLVAGCRWLPSR